MVVVDGWAFSSCAGGGGGGGGGSWLQGLCGGNSSSEITFLAFGRPLFTGFSVSIGTGDLLMPGGIS